MTSGPRGVRVYPSFNSTKPLTALLFLLDGVPVATPLTIPLYPFALLSEEKYCGRYKSIIQEHNTLTW